MSRFADIAAPILPGSVLIAILGAGQASRFGADKLLQPCAGKPLGKWALDAARAMGLPVIWIAGAQAPSFVDCELAFNPHAAQGMGSSVAAAARTAIANKVDLLLVLLADMPLVTPDLLHRLMSAGAPAACAYGDYPGVPALIPARDFEAALGLSGDRGAAALLRDREVTLIKAAPEELFDVDTREALAKAERLLLARHC